MSGLRRLLVRLAALLCAAIAGLCLLSPSVAVATSVNAGGSAGETYSKAAALFAASTGSGARVVALANPSNASVASMALSPTAVDVSSGAATVTVQVHVKDPSGIYAAWLVISGSGVRDVDVGLGVISGTTQDCVCQGSAQIPQSVPGGMRQLTLYVADSAGTSVLDATALAAQGLPSTLAVTDSSPAMPSVVSLSLSPTVVDVSSGPGTVTVTMHAKDSSAITDNWVKVGHGNWGVNAGLELVSGTAQDGVWQGTAVIPEYAPSGTWQMTAHLLDEIGAQANLDPTTLASDGLASTFEVTDTFAATPTVLSMTVSPEAVDVSSGPATVSVQIRYQDINGLSGDLQIEKDGSRSPLPADFSLISGTWQDGTWQAVTTIPQDAGAGMWQLYLELDDYAGQYRGLGPTDLAADGFPSAVAVTNRTTARPVTTLSGVSQGVAYASQATFSLSATEPFGAGVSGTYYTLDSGPQQTYVAPVVTHTVGTHALSYWSVDQVGNQETTQSVTFSVSGSPAPPAPTSTPAPTSAVAPPTTWTAGPAPQGFTTSLRCVRPMGATTAWAVGGGELVRTRDAGATWSSYRGFWSWGASSLNYLQSTDGSSGWIVGSGGSIFKFEDGGGDWINQSADTTANLTCVASPNANTAWIVADDGTILKTTDGGTTWTPESSGTGAALNSVCFTSSNVGVIVGSSGTILRTANGGQTWIGEVSGTTVDLSSVFFASATRGWAVGEGGTILTTTNGGTSWTPQVSGTTLDLSSVDFTDTTHGWAVGQDGIALYTSDGGARWTAHSTGCTAWLRSVSFLNSNTGWAAGDDTVVRATVGTPITILPLPASIVPDVPGYAETIPFCATGTLDPTYGPDAAAVYKIHLSAGESYDFWLDGSASTDYWLMLYAPGITAIDPAISSPIAQEFAGLTARRSFVYTAASDGDYYIAAEAWPVEGPSPVIPPYNMPGTFVLNAADVSAIDQGGGLPGAEQQVVPFTTQGTLDSGVSKVDQFYLFAGQTVNLALSADAGTADSLSLAAPGQKVIASSGASTTAGTLRASAATASMTYKAAASGYYSAVVKASGAAGAYQLVATAPGSGITITRSTASVRLPTSFVLSGVLTPGHLKDPCVVYVKKPGSSRWSYSSNREAYSVTRGGANWWYRYAPKLRGTYSFYVLFAGDTLRAKSQSKVITVVVR